MVARYSGRIRFRPVRTHPANMSDCSRRSQRVLCFVANQDGMTTALKQAHESCRGSPAAVCTGLAGAK